MKHNLKIRLLSLLLCISMIVPVVAKKTSVEAEGEKTTTTNYGAAIGAVAEIGAESVNLYGTPAGEETESIFSGVSPDALPEKVVITDYYYNEDASEETNRLWYEIDAAPGYTWPEAYESAHWLYAYSVDIVAENGTTGVFDAEGNAVTELTMGVYDKPVLTAESSLQGSVKYQWQICYDTEKDLWVDIYGADEAELTVSIGMIATLLVDGTVNVRCVSASGSKKAVSEVVEITVDFDNVGGDSGNEDEPDEPVAEPKIEIQMNGNIVTELKMADSEYSYSADLSVVTDMTGEVTYTWAMVNSTGVHVLSDLTSANVTILKMNHINSYVERIDDTSVFGATLRITASNGTQSVSCDVAISVIENAASGSVSTDNGAINFIVAGDGVADTTVELTQTTSSVVFPEGETALLALDITLRDANGNEWQPAEGEEVQIIVDAYKLGLSEGDYFAVYHVHDGETQLFGPYQVKDGYITFEVKGFSEFVFSTNYGAAIGGVAEFDRTGYVLLDFAAVDFLGQQVEVDLLPKKIVIKNYVFDDYLGKLFYEIDAAPGYTWPTEYADLHWCYSDALTNINVNGEAGVYDENGDSVTEVTVSTTESITVKVETSLQSADIDYKWQICYDTENDLWVDITGETSSEITITAGMIVSLMDANKQVEICCTTTVGSKTVISDPITVTLYVEDSGATEEPKVEIQIDGTSADSVDVNDADKNDFNSILSANTNLSGEVTYSWEVLSDPVNGLWEVLGTEATFMPVFDRWAEGTYVGNSYYIHYVDATTSAITIRLKVSDGVTTLTDTFVISLKYEAEEEAAYVEYKYRWRSASVASSSESTNTAAETNTTTYNVIIKYMNQDGTAVVADPYTSTVSPTTVLTNTISFPKIIGYAPMVYNQTSGNWVRQDSYTFDGTLFTGDFTLEVRYFPDAVDYKVNIYIQNAENDEYVLMDSYIRQELTGTVIDKIQFTVDGYYQSKFSSNHAEIAADGSTEFNLYYDRIYYLMKFDLDGGYGVQPIYARHGVKLDIPNPTKAGYTFVGWDQTEGTPAVNNEILNDGIANTMYEYMPIGNTAYKAIWKAVDNAKVTIVYWGENPNDEGYSYLESQELYVKPGTELTFGTDQLVCTLTEHAHGSGCTYNCGKTPHTHTVEAGCYQLICTKESHNHTESGCTLNCTHTHTLNCYNNGDLNEISQPSASLTNKGNGIYTYIRKDNVVGWFDVTCYCLNIDGKWYQADDDTTEITLSCTHGHTNVCWSCDLNEGTHVHSVEQGCYKLTCTTEAHTHIADCYSCIAHTHNDDCYLKTTNQDSILWNYVKSDTVTVAADGSTVMNVYYDRTEFTLKFNESNKTVRTIKGKWGADIRSYFPIVDENNGTKYSTYWWRVPDGATSLVPGKIIASIDKIPAENLTFTSSRQSDAMNIYYYVEAEEGTITYGGIKFKEYKKVETGKISTLTYKEEFHDITGYKQYYSDPAFSSHDENGTASAKTDNYMYYVALSYNLEFHNGQEIVKTESVKYTANLGSYKFTPVAPSKYEAGSVEFAGWYQNPECTGVEVKLDETTMSASNMILYAKWVPVKHNVTVYRYRDADGTLHDLLCNHTDETIGEMQGLGAISHGDMLNKHYIPEKPTNGNYTFVTWAYYDEDLQEEVTIDINNFVVTKDVEIYAKWSSNVQVPYTIKYMIQGTTTEIAKRNEGKHYAGETHTFNAKTAGQLNAGYQTGYFPTVTSHSINFKAEDNSYEYIFYYVQKDAVPYTVYYVTDQQNAAGTLKEIKITEGEKTTTYYIVADTKTVSDNRNAIVTENFKTVQGYMPDAYQKTLIIDGSEGAVNQIIFKYSVDTTHAYYKVTHYTEQLDGSWYAHATYTHVGTINDRYTEGEMDITGYTFKNIEYKVNGGNATDVTNEGAKLTADGLEINLYYTRNKYPYAVQYILQGTDTVLYTETFAEEDYGETVSHKAPLYWETGNVYERVSAETLSTTIQTDASKNVITFYYMEREVTIKYEVANGFGGTVNPSQETVLIKSGDAVGSTAEPLSNDYKFVGWYDAQGNLLFTGAEFVPKKVDGLHVEATYYAKFEYNLTSLTIVKKGAEAHKDIDPNQTFIFNISGNGVDLDVTVHRDENGIWSTTIDGLTVGATYTVTEKTDWSWRYNCDKWEYGTDSGTGNVAGITLGLDGTITFTNTRSEEKWLDGDSYKVNIFGTVQSQN